MIYHICRSYLRCFFISVFLSGKSFGSCQFVEIMKTFTSIEELKKRETVLTDFPWEIKLRTSMLTAESKKFVTSFDPTIIAKDTQVSNPVFPVSKREPYVDRVLLFGHAKLEESKIHFYPQTKTGQKVENMYPHNLPHPSLIDYYSHSNRMQLFKSYKEQNLPWKAWQNIFMDEFSLANYRSFEIAISNNLSLKAFARVYIGSKTLGVEGDLFGVDTPKTELFSAGFAAGKYPAHLMPIERLLKRLHLDTSPIDQLRQQFPDYTLVEVGRLFVDRVSAPKERALAKKLLLSAVLEVMQEMNLERDLSKVILVASAGPLGSRLYPKEFDMKKILTAKIKPENLVQDLPDGADEIGGIPVQFFWLPDQQSAFKGHGQSKPHDLSVFAATGDLVKRHLIQGNSAYEDFPVMDHFPYMIYNSMLDRIQPQ